MKDEAQSKDRGRLEHLWDAMRRDSGSDDALQLGTADEVLTALREGRLSVADMSPEMLGTIEEEIGSDALADAVAEQENQGVQTSYESRRWWRVAFPVAAAAVLFVGVFIAINVAVVNPESADLADGSTAAMPAAFPLTDIGWGDLPSLEVAGTFRASPEDPNSLKPDFSAISTQTMGGSGVDARSIWRLATVIVKSEHGFGSGVLVDKDGLVLTNYHVVSDAVQRAALQGHIGEVELILPELVDGVVRARYTHVRATVVRSSPAFDLAVLRAEVLPTDSPRLVLAPELPAEGADCWVIGSPAGLPAWLTRQATVVGVFDFPSGLSDSIAASDSTAVASLDRERPRVIVTDAPISGGDSGGPLLNNNGEIVGLTFATPTNLTSGAVGFHIDLSHLRTILAGDLSEPEVVPPDVWSAALDGVRREGPRVATDGNGTVTGLQFIFRPAFTGSQGSSEILALGEPVAVLQFQADPLAPISADQLAEHPEFRVPRGLWDMESIGAFPWSYAVLQRRDGSVVTAYLDDEGVIADVRIGSDVNGDWNVAYLRDADGDWSVSTTSHGRRMLDAEAAGFAVNEPGLKRRLKPRDEPGQRGNVPNVIPDP